MSRSTRPTTRKYGLGRFVLDLLLGFLTGGLWWVFLVFKAIRS
jgi:hypothetical protein